jgi:hypothetical protein
VKSRVHSDLSMYCLVLIWSYAPNRCGAGSLRGGVDCSLSLSYVRVAEFIFSLTWTVLRPKFAVLLTRLYLECSRLVIKHFVECHEKMTVNDHCDRNPSFTDIRFSPFSTLCELNIYHISAGKILWVVIRRWGFCLHSDSTGIGLWSRYIWQ